MKKLITKGLLAGAVALGVAGCDNKTEYHFDGKIGKEQVKFYEANISSNYLEVVKENGVKVEYRDVLNDNLKLDGLKITKEGVITWYWDDVVGKDVLAKAQEQFDNYLEKIIEIKRKEGLENLEWVKEVKKWRK